MENDDQIHCPKCNSTQITANKKGFSGGKAVAGVVLTGGIGLLAGGIGRNKVIITCLNCGKQFKPGEGKSTAAPVAKKEPRIIWDAGTQKHVVNPSFQNVNNIDYERRGRINKGIAKVFCPLFIVLSIVFFACSLIFLGSVFLVFGLLFLAMASAKARTA